MPKTISGAKTTRLTPPQFHKEYEDPWNKLIIDLSALQSNYALLKSRLPTDTILFSVLKSDAYGHGIIEVGKTLSESGCRHFAVESPREGILLRNEGITGEILLMNPIPLWMAELAVRNDLSVSVIHESILEPLEKAATTMGKMCRIHLNANVGLNRMGISPSKIVKIAREVTAKPHLEFEGLFGQPRDFHSAVDSYKQLREIHHMLISKDIGPNYLHFANSTTFLAHPETIADGVRLGILLYGILPPEQYKEKFDLKGLVPTMRLKSELVQIRDLPKGSSIGYRSRSKTDRDTVIGTIPIGYYHGLDRNTLKDGYVLIHGKKAPFIGSISMNSSTIDITNIKGPAIGDRVIIFGKRGDQELNINELAEKSGTIAAELMMRFGNGIARSYEFGDQEVNAEICLDEKKVTKRIQYIETENELPSWANVYDVTRFLQTNLEPYDDPKDVIATAIDYALSSNPLGKGFILLASENKKILGVLVSVQIDKVGIIPENLIVYVCVHRKHRGKGLGSRLLQEAIECTEGDVKLHAERTNPAIKLYKKLGFKDDYIEMRLIKGVQ